jgi:predicted enzyme related to lactoylglutathione lyase
LFGWSINPFPGGDGYWHIDTGGADDSPDGALKGRKHPQEPIVNYVSVDSVPNFSKKIEKLGGKICMAKTAVPQMGYFAVCQDTEGNSFGIWESDANAK